MRVSLQEIERDIQRPRESSVKDGGKEWSEMSTSQINIKDCRQPPEAGRDAWDGFSLRASRRNQLYPHLDFGLRASRIVRQLIPIV